MGARAVVGLLFGLWMAGCGGASVAPQPLPEPAYVSLRAEVRGIARPACGSCHTAGLATAKPEAVAAFDFARDDWDAGLDPGQLDFFFDRIGAEMARDDLRTVRRFVAAAKAR